MNRLLGGIFAAATFAGTAFAQDVPQGYPAEYAQIIEGSKAEGKLLIYDNISEANWSKLIPRFREKYPWIQIDIPHLTTNEVFSRWEVESGTGVETGDIIVNGDPDTWLRVADKMMPYESPEAAALPDFAKPRPGIYVLSTDPFMFVYNTALLPEGDKITTLAELAEAAKADPGTFNQRITSYDPARHVAGVAIWRAITHKLGEEGWKSLETLIPMMRLEVSSGPMTEKVTTGEYVFTVAGTGIVVFPKLRQAGGEILGVSYPKDISMIQHRFVSIPANSKNVNSAKLLMDFVLSAEGQGLLGEGGLTPYREDVQVPDNVTTLADITAKVPLQDLVIVDMNPEVIGTLDAFRTRWNEIAAKR